MGDVNNIGMITAARLSAGTAGSTGLAPALLALQRHGKRVRHCPLPGTRISLKQIRMTDFIHLNGILQMPDQLLMTDNILKS